MIVDVGRDDFHHDVAPWLPFRATWTRDIRANPLPLKRSWRPEQLVDGVPEEIIDLLARWPKATSRNRACAEVDCRYSIARNSRSSSPDASRNAIEDEPDIVITLTPNSLSNSGRTGRYASAKPPEISTGSCACGGGAAAKRGVAVNCPVPSATTAHLVESA